MKIFIAILVATAILLAPQVGEAKTIKNTRKAQQKLELKRKCNVQVFVRFGWIGCSPVQA